MLKRILMLMALVASCALPFGCGNGKAQPQTRELPDLVAELQNGKDEESACKEILANRHDPKQLYELLSGPREYPQATATGWSCENIELEANYMLGFGYFIPENYNPKHAYPVIITLHGAVGTREPYNIKQVAEVTGGAFGELFAPSGEQYIVISPQGSYKALWWTKNGRKMILGALEYVKRHYHVDTDRVFVMGFSDGGSASYFLSSTTPTPFAAFFSLNGHPAVADSAFRLFFHNMRNRPMLICNTTEDNLYPPETVMPFVDRLKSSGAEVSFSMFENIGHTPAYLEQIQPELVEWFRQKRRNAWANKVEVAMADFSFSRVDWLTILESGDNVAPCEVDDLSVSLQPARQLGVAADAQYRGNGIRVASVISESDAERMGIIAGDILISVNGQKLSEGTKLPYLLAQAKGSLRVTIQRAEIELELFGSLSDQPAIISYDNLPMKAYARATVSGNVLTISANGARQVRIAIRPGFINLDRPVLVYGNGTKVFESMVSFNCEAIIASWLEDHDSSTLAAAYIVVDIP